MNTEPWNEPPTGFDHFKSDFGSSVKTVFPASPVVSLYASATVLAKVAASVARAASIFSSAGGWICVIALEALRPIASPDKAAITACARMVNLIRSPRVCRSVC